MKKIGKPVITGIYYRFDYRLNGSHKNNDRYKVTYNAYDGPKGD